VPKCIQDISGALVALNRLVDFLNRDEVDISEWERGQGGPGNDATGGIVFDGLTIGWPKGEADGPGTFELQEVDLAIPRGKLTLVCGPLGSGKTLLVG
jgi:ABC-type multidrug transport system fused ATPase/permease subunit